MAKGKKTGGRDFEPGNSANPNGRPKLPEDIKESRKLNKSELERIFNRFLVMLPSELIKITKAGELNAKEMLVASVITKAITTGDQHRFDFILNRLIGKVTEKVQHTLPRPVIIKRRKGGQVELTSELPKEDEDDSE